MATLQLKATHRRRRLISLPIQDISPLPNEARLFQLLDAFCEQLRDSGEGEVECRVAGGWVRDKLLGVDSHDIDIALSSMSGAPFAAKFVPFVRSQGVDTGNTHIIKENPGQSKHLETATVVILGSDIDFVNLRSETYATDSRIPSSMSFGTPLQDALRRDINFNALFYNIHTNAIEDETGKGLEDLKSGLVRTPLPPKETFLDDPLRVLRCIRFASRFGFELDPSIVTAAQDPQIQEALSHKVARERIGEEINKMLTGADPATAVSLLLECGLLPPIFTPPGTNIVPLPQKLELGLAASLLLARLLDGDEKDLPHVHDTLTISSKTQTGTRARLYLGALLSPFQGMTYMERRKKLQASEYVVREALKLGSQNHYVDGIPRMFEALPLLRNIAVNQFDVESRRSGIGLCLRQKTVHDANCGLHWASSLLFSLLQELTALWDCATDTILLEAADEIIRRYNEFVVAVEAYNLPADLDKRPILTGNEVCELLGPNVTGGPWLKEVLESLVSWQLDHPAAAREDASNWLVDEHKKGNIEIPPNNKRRKLGPSPDH